MDRRKTKNPERIFSEQQTQPTYGVNTKPLNPWPHWWEASAYPRLATNQPHGLTAEKLQSKRSEVFRQRSGPASNEIASTILNRRKDFLESLCHPCYHKYILLRGRIKKLSHQLYGNIMESFSPLVVWKNSVCDLHGHVFIHNDELNIVIIHLSCTLSWNHTHSSAPGGAEVTGYPHCSCCHCPWVRLKCNSSTEYWLMIWPNDFGNKL